MSTGRAPEFTPKQAKAWPEAVAAVQRYVDTSTVSTDLHSTDWTVEWAEESRPGRGQHFTGVYCDGEYLAHVLMDVYGYPSVSVAELTWLHNSMNEECDCAPCVADRDEDGDQS